MMCALQRIGWIGAGKMGRPMVRRLLARGYQVTVFDICSASHNAAVEDGAEGAASISELLCRSEIVMSMIPDDDVLGAVVFGENGLAGRLGPQQIFIDLSTISPSFSRKVSRSLGTERYLRAPVSGSTQLAESGSLLIIASGPQCDFDLCQAPLAELSTKQYYVGAGEEARYLKLVLNSLVAANASLLADALALGEAGGLARQSMMDIVCASAVASPLLQYKRASIVADDYPPAFSVAQMIKDLGLIADAAADVGVDMPFNAISLQRFEDAVASGQAERDFFVLCARKPESV